MWGRILVPAAMLAMTPIGVKAADLVVWWQKGTYAQEDEALRDIIAAFEQETGKQVELSFYQENELQDKIVAALQAGQPPDFAFSFLLSEYISEWAFDDRLVDLTDAIGHFSDLFDPDALASWVRLNQKTGRRALYALPVGRTTNHLHVWKSLLEQAGFTLEDIPTEWNAFWSFWCDQVQPAVRRATGREDIWGVGLAMAGNAEASYNFLQLMSAYDADYVTRDGRLVIDDPEVRRGEIEALDGYTAAYRKGCTPPDSVAWDPFGNNEAFLAQRVVMTLNESLSIPNALKRERPDDYYKNTATIEWPLGPHGEVFPIEARFLAAVAFKDGPNVETAKEFVRFLVAEGWLMHYLDFSGERMMPAMPKLLDAPFWLDPSDPHRMAAVMQVASRPTHHDYATVSGDWRYDLVAKENVWGNAVHRVAAEGISPEQAVDEAIARIKQILQPPSERSPR
jgi:multiple sugar transport system substrate-binding protein